MTRDVLRLAGVRRRAVLVGDGERLVDLRRALGLGRSGIDYEFLGAIALGRRRPAACRCSAASMSCRAILA